MNSIKNNIDLSVIIPSRSPAYLKNTIEDILKKSETNIEVIVVLDGIWTNEIVEDKRVIYIHHGTQADNKGMRAGINKGVALSKGKYIMKCDEHVMFGQGFDRILIADCKDDWLVIPRRKRLDPDKWEIEVDKRPDIDYMIIDYPFATPYDIKCGLHGAEYRDMYYKRKDILIDDVMTCQGSCYFLSRKLWDSVIHELDDVNYGTFTMEAQELTNKVWLSGGRVIVNKKTWYAHAHKGSKGKGYNFTNAQYKKHQEDKEKGRVYAIDYWLNTKDYKYPFSWLVEKFWPLPGWPIDWKERIKTDRLHDFSATYKTYEYKK